MTVDDRIKLIEELTDTGVAGVHTQVSRINNYAEYTAARITRNSLSKIADTFEIIMSELNKAYLKNLKNQIDDSSILVSARRMFACREFFIEEFNIFQSVINEYEKHMLCGNLIRALTGQDRRDYDTK